MNRRTTLTTVALCAALTTSCAPTSSGGATSSASGSGTPTSTARTSTPSPTSTLPALQVTSTSIQDGAALPTAQMSGRLGVAGGQDASPQLTWSAGPAATKSYTVTVFDPDAPGTGYWHWAVHDLPAATRALPEGVGRKGGKLLPAGARQALNDNSTASYVGAAPPGGSGLHHYHVVVTALDVPKLPAPADATASTLQPLIDRHALARGEIVATAER